MKLFLKLSRKYTLCELLQSKLLPRIIILTSSLVVHRVNLLYEEKSEPLLENLLLIISALIIKFFVLSGSTSIPACGLVPLIL